MFEVRKLTKRSMIMASATTEAIMSVRIGQPAALTIDHTSLLQAMLNLKLYPQQLGKDKCCLLSFFFEYFKTSKEWSNPLLFKDFFRPSTIPVDNFVDNSKNDRWKPRQIRKNVRLPTL